MKLVPSFALIARAGNSDRHNAIEIGLIDLFARSFWI